LDIRYLSVYLHRNGNIDWRLDRHIPATGPGSKPRYSRLCRDGLLGWSCAGEDTFGLRIPIYGNADRKALGPCVYFDCGDHAASRLVCSFLHRQLDLYGNCWLCPGSHVSNESNAGNEATPPRGAHDSFGSHILACEYGVCTIPISDRGTCQCERPLCVTTNAPRNVFRNGRSMVHLPSEDPREPLSSTERSKGLDEGDG